MHFKCCAIYTRSAPNTTETNKITQIKRFKKIAKDFYSSMKHSTTIGPTWGLTWGTLQSIRDPKMQETLKSKDLWLLKKRFKQVTLHGRTCHVQLAAPTEVPLAVLGASVCTKAAPIIQRLPRKSNRSKRCKGIVVLGENTLDLSWIHHGFHVHRICPALHSGGVKELGF